MSCRVPDFVPEEDNPPVFPRKIPDSVGADFVESIWHKGPFFRRRSPDLNHADPAIPCRTEPYAASALSSHTAATAAAAPMASTELFMEEDEMASWLYYPLGGDDDPGGVGSVAGANPTEQPRQAAAVAGSEQGFPAAAGDLKMEADVWPASERPPRHPDRRVMSVSLAAPPPPPPPASRESTLVDSSATTEPGRTGRGAESSRVSSGGARCAAAACEHGPASSSGVSWEGEAAAMPAARGDERKRKGRNNEDGCDSHSDDAEYFESGGERRSASARRARAAEVHNLSERRRRDRINEKMKALQQLIPRCHRSDKASMLDDAIEYMKSLQMQVQMMSMYCNMAPMMFPGVQQYMPSMGMGIPMGMGMGMGMEMASGGLSYPMLPFPTVMPGAQIAANGAAHLSQRLPLQAVRSPVTALADQLRLQGTTQADPAASSSASIRAPSAVQMPNLASVCHQVQAQNRAVTAPGTSKGANVPDKSKFG